MTPDETHLILRSFWVSLGTSAIMAWPLYRMLLALRSRQTVSEYAPESHQAKQGTPTMGGLIVLVGFLAGVLAGAPDTSLIALVLGFAAIGFLDDFVVPRCKPGARGLGWKPKLVLQLLTAGAVLWWSQRDAGLAAIAIGCFVILFSSNAYNFADGLDGLAGTIGVLLCIGLVALALLSGLPTIAVAPAAIIAGFVPFLALNAPPARVFMGDIGSLPIGAALGYVALELSGEPTMFPPLAVLSGILLLELVPVPLQIFWVKVFKKRLFSYTPIHHAFEKRGWPESRVVWLFGLIQFVLTAGALSLAIAGASR